MIQAVTITRAIASGRHVPHAFREKRIRTQRYRARDLSRFTALRRVCVRSGGPHGTG